MKRAVLILVCCLSLIVYAREAAIQKLPASLFFVANEGQWEEPFAFKASVGNVLYYVTPQGMTLDIRQYERSHIARDPMDRFDPRHEPEPVSVRGHVLKINYLNANTHPQILGEAKLASYSNYFLGRDSCKWRSFVGHYQTVRMKEVWPGIDVVQKIQADGVETLYRVSAGANAQQISVQIEGLTAPLRTDGQGNLILSTSLGEIKEKAPFAYQIINHRQVELPVRFQVLDHKSYTLSAANFDASKELVIDPLVYSTFLGGLGMDRVEDVDIDPQRNKIVAGATEADDFPVTAGAYQTQLTYMSEDGFISKFNDHCDSLLFSTFLGAQGGGTILEAVKCPRNGSVYAGGYTESHLWPITPDAFDTLNRTGNETAGVFVRLSSDGAALEFSSYFSGTVTTEITDLGIDEHGLIYFCGSSFGGGFPITPNAIFQNTGGGPGFLSVFNPLTSTLQYSTCIPGNALQRAFNINIVSPEIVWVSGQTGSTDLPVTPNAIQSTIHSDHNDGFFSLWNLEANRLEYMSYLGSSWVDQIEDLFVVNTHQVVLTGVVGAHDFPITPSAYDTTYHSCFVTLVDLDSGIVVSTFFGGSTGERGIGIYGDSANFVIVGNTSSADFPCTHNAYDSVYSGGESDLFISRFNANLTRLEYSTLLGGAGTDQCFSTDFTHKDSVWIVGNTGSGNFPITSNAFQSSNHGFGDGFLSCFVLPDSNSSIAQHKELIPANPSLQIYPNPFNPSTTLAFNLPTTSPVRVILYNLLGRSVWQSDLGRLNAGAHRVPLNTPTLPSGAYVVRIKAGKAILDQKAILLK
jgi:hypothetical protein